MCVCGPVFARVPTTVFVYNVGVHLSVKCVIGSWFNFHEKIMAECNQMVCAFVCSSCDEGRECLLVGLCGQTCVCAFVSVRLFQIRVPLYKV